MRFDRRRGGRGGGRFRDRRPRYDLPKPVKVGEEYDVEIKEVGSKGDGIARIKNFVVFVNGAKMGEKIKVKITDVRGRFATAEKVGAASEETATEDAEKEISKEVTEEAEVAPEEETKESPEEEAVEAPEEEAKEVPEEGPKDVSGEAAEETSEDTVEEATEEDIVAEKQTAEEVATDEDAVEE